MSEQVGGGSAAALPIQRGTNYATPDRPDKDRYRPGRMVEMVREGSVGDGGDREHRAEDQREPAIAQRVASGRQWGRLLGRRSGLTWVDSLDRRIAAEIDARYPVGHLSGHAAR